MHRLVWVFLYWLWHKGLFRVAHEYEPQLQKTYLLKSARSEDSDQPAHLRSLIWIFTGRSLGSQGCKVSSCGQRRLWSDCADAQADQSLRWTHMSEGTFFDIVAHNITMFLIRPHYVMAWKFIDKNVNSRNANVHVSNHVYIMHQSFETRPIRCRGIAGTCNFFSLQSLGKRRPLRGHTCIYGKLPAKSSCPPPRVVANKLIYFDKLLRAFREVPGEYAELWNPVQSPAVSSGNFSGKLKSRLIYGTAGIHRRLNHSNWAPLCPRYPRHRRGGGFKCLVHNKKACSLYSYFLLDLWVHFDVLETNVLLLKADTRGALDWLQSPVTKYFFS